MQIFRFSSARVKIHQISHVIFQTKNDFFYKVWIALQCHERQLFCTFSVEALYGTDKRSTSKCTFSDLPLLALKFTKFVMSILKPRASFSSHFTSLSSAIRTLLYFSSKTLYAFDKRDPLSANFQTFNYSYEN